MGTEFDGLEMTMNCGPCHRCGERRPDARPQELIGGFEAVLCVPCVNDWTEFVGPHEAWLALKDINDERRSILAQIKADGRDRLDRLKQLSREEFDHESVLFAAAKAWVSERPA